MNTVITISRQFGSGGRLIGKMLAEELNIPFYDKEIIDLAAEKSGLTSNFIEENEQKMRGLNLYAFAPSYMGGSILSTVENIETRIFAYEADAIRNLAKQGASVIVGRCAEYVLKDDFKCFTVYVHSDTENRIKRIMEVYSLCDDVKRAEKMIKSNDRTRAKHHEFYTDTAWGNPSNYHLTINSGKLGIENSTAILKNAYLRYDGYIQ